VIEEESGRKGENKSMQSRHWRIERVLRNSEMQRRRVSK
jgi:hypothetical protein